MVCIGGCASRGTMPHFTHPPAMIRSDGHGLPPKPTNQRPCQKSLVCLLPTGSVCPLVRVHRGRCQPRPRLPRSAVHDMPQARRTLSILGTPSERLLLIADGGSQWTPVPTSSLSCPTIS